MAFLLIASTLALTVVVNYVLAQAPLVTVNLPLTINEDQRYITNVNMSSDPDTQRFRFALAANTGYSAVAGTACSNCNSVPPYNSSMSSTAQSFPGSKNLTLGSQSVSGNFIKENCSLHEVNGSAWQYPNQTIIVANSSSLFSGSTSGILGIGTNANGATGDFNDTIFGGWLSRNPAHNNFSFGMALQAPDFTNDNDAGNGGIIHWVVPDPSAFTGSVSTRNAQVASSISGVGTGGSSDVAANGFSTPDSDWTVEMDGWGANVGSSTVSNKSSTNALIEPWFPNMYFPVSQANLLYSTIPGAVQRPTLTAGAQVWNVPCDTEIALGFQFDQNFILDQADFVVPQGNGTCIGAVQGWPDPSIDYFLLGGRFISAFYLIFVVGRPGSGVPNSIGIANRLKPSSKSSHTGAIVGGAVGGVAFLALLALGAAFFLIRRRRRNRRAPSGIAKQEQMAVGEKYYDGRNGDDEDGAQYARPMSQSMLGHGTMPTPPHSAFSTSSSHPLLPEPQSPQSPFLSMPGTPISSIQTFTTPGTSSYAGSHLGHVQQRAGSVYTDANGQNVTIDPYFLPSLPESPGATTGRPRDMKVQHWRPPREEGLVSGGPSQGSNLINLDPMGTSTTSEAGSGGQSVPLPQPPAGAMRSTKGIEAMNAYRDASRRLQTPAPPYSTQEHQTALDNAVSPTLVDFNPSSNFRDERA